MNLSHNRHTFSIAITLFIILSTNVVSQSICARESEGDTSTLRSSINNSDLLVSMKPIEDTVKVGDHVNFIITVTDLGSKPIGGAKIYGKMIYPDEIHKHTFEGKTHDNGKFIFPLTIDNRISLGELEINVKITADGYKPRSLSSTFSVLSASDSNSNNDFDHGIQYMIRGSPKVKNAYSFAFAGDYTCDSATRETVNAMKKKNPDLVLAVGDLSETKDPDCFFKMFKSLDEKGKLKVALGYHDMDEGDGSSSRFSQYLSHFDMANPFYAFDYKNIHFLVMTTGLDSLIPYGKGSQQYNFVKSDLAQASINNKIDWIIVVSYQPFYTSPTEHQAPSNLRVLYSPLFEKYGVDLVITAHNHNYQRTYPLYLASKHSSSPEIKNKNGNNYNNPSAPIYVTVGTAGAELYEFDGQAPFIAAQTVQAGFLNVEILKDRTQLKAKFLGGQSTSDTDYFTINKT